MASGLFSAARQAQASGWTPTPSCRALKAILTPGGRLTFRLVITGLALGRQGPRDSLPESIPGASEIAATLRYCQCAGCGQGGPIYWAGPQTDVYAETRRS